MNTKFSGGGVLPIVRFKDRLYFLTFSSKRGVLSDAGGKCDFGESIETTCTREFYEESCKLFNVTPIDISSHKFIDINSGRTFYRSYIPLFNIDLVQDQFVKNRRVLKSTRCSYHYLEKSDIVLIPIDSKFTRLNIKSNKIYTTEDISGQLRLINRRLYKLIREFRKLDLYPKEVILEKVDSGNLITYNSKLN